MKEISRLAHLVARYAGCIRTQHYPALRDPMIMAFLNGCAAGSVVTLRVYVTVPAGSQGAQ
jgi:hypothetical protein